MRQPESHHVTQLLLAWSEGDENALETLAPLVYNELRRLARFYMRRERPGATLQSTALVHEAFLRLIDQHVQWNSRAHFFGIAAQMMRRILVDHAKAQLTRKRGAGGTRVELDEGLAASPQRDVDLLALDEALQRLSSVDPQRSQIVELRFFGGLSNEESALVLGISPATVQRQWAGARAWLYHELRPKKRGEVADGGDLASNS
ncbi:MAG: sigma-70 family RNA polymerase sigma factor [Acidobacteriaceae bacterium]|nr:sigma-70 family RNA polymerase sigma factor [Acidobacteriaceae bacterium]